MILNEAFIAEQHMYPGSAIAPESLGNLLHSGFNGTVATIFGTVIQTA
jgi:hypothetical protein